MKSLIVTIVAIFLAQISFACSANFTYTTGAVNNNLLNLNYTNTSTAGTIPAGYHVQSTVYYGDGSSDNTPIGYVYNHNYSTPGTYSVTLYLAVVDSPGTTIYCSDSITQSITVSYPICATSWTSVAGSNGSVTFTASNPGGATGLTYFWHFGDGGSAIGNPVTHTYAANGTYTVYMIDSSSTCNYFNQGNVTVTSIPANCSGAHALFTSSTSGLTANFNNTSTYSGFSASVSAAWSFGDGGSSFAYSPSHTYATAGTYPVQLVMIWTDSIYSITCIDTVNSTVTVSGTAALNQITGWMSWDSLAAGNPMNPEFKVWLIQYDSATSNLYAVDSVNVISWPYSFIFNNEPAGSYRVKAALTNGPTSGTAAVPTYGYDSLYWSGAHVINYSGSGVNSGNYIILQNGTVTSGPGFIAGNVTSGANKGTHTNGIPAPGITMFLEDMSGKALAYAITDANGSYQFSNFAAGSYIIYPEGLGYVTTPTIINASTSQVTNVDFIQHTISKTITPVTAGVVNVTTNNAAFNVFPNPGNGIFNISWSSKTALQNAHTIVNDVVGRKVFETDLNMNATSGYTQLNLSQLKDGVYFISVNAGDVNYTTKVVLQH